MSVRGTWVLSIIVVLSAAAIVISGLTFGWGSPVREEKRVPCAGEVFDDLSAAFSDADDAEEREAALAHVREPASVKALLAVSGDAGRSAPVRIRAAELLFRSGARRADAAACLVGFLESGEVRVRKVAFGVLAEISGDAFGWDSVKESADQDEAFGKWKAWAEGWKPEAL